MNGILHTTRDTVASEKPPPYINAAVTLPVFSTFTYSVPPDLVERAAVGKRVLLPFGRRLLTGYILSLDGTVPSGVKIKAVKKVLDDEGLFPESMIPFFQWVADYYLHPIGEVIQTALPGGLTVVQTNFYALTESGRKALTNVDLDRRTRQALEAAGAKPCRLRGLQAAAGGTLGREKVTGWVKKGWLSRSTGFSGDSSQAKTERFVVPAVAVEPPKKLSPQRAAILSLLAERGALSMAELKKQVATAPSLVRAMTADGQVVVEHRRVYRDPLGEIIEPDQPPVLTAEQHQAVAIISRVLGRTYQTFLLDGVTGSGKTEVYLQLAALAMHKSLATLVLVPEIALISQMERAFRARFGDCVAVLHSGLSKGERFDQWQRICRGETPVVIGARSAIFAPLERIGLLVVDEEHDDSYKQEGSLRYNARDMAVVRGRLSQAVVVLGSATPSLQSAYNAQKGKFKVVHLRQRVEQGVMPQVHVQDLSDLREERGIRKMLSPALLSAIRETLDRREQVLLFINRRGFAGTLICADCGQPLRCDHCDISLTYHQSCNAYRCHYCGFSKAAVSRCERCGSHRIKRLGLGTERLQQAMVDLFPGARIARLDRDTTRAKGALVKILRSLRDQLIDILVGTQMVAKGHDYPNITLVGIICADLSLNLPDFRAGERTFQLLAQVAGRAGRGRAAGRVILQTFNPDHFSIQTARHQDFDAFYRQEIQVREMLGYPPFTRMIQIRVHGRDPKETAGQAQALGARCRRIAERDERLRGVTLLGPIEAPLARIADHHRWQLLLKSADTGALHSLVRELLFSQQAGNRQGRVHVSADVDPLFLM